MSRVFRQIGRLISRPGIVRHAQARVGIAIQIPAHLKPSNAVSICPAGASTGFHVACKRTCRGPDHSPPEVNHFAARPFAAHADKKVAKQANFSLAKSRNSCPVSGMYNTTPRVYSALAQSVHNRSHSRAPRGAPRSSRRPASRSRDSSVPPITSSPHGEPINSCPRSS